MDASLPGAPPSATDDRMRSTVVSSPSTLISVSASLATKLMSLMRASLPPAGAALAISLRSDSIFRLAPMRA